MTVVEQWTGATAALLRSAMRMTVRGFADHLGVSPRTVTGWETGGGTRIPKPDSQEMLDTALKLADRDVRQRFAVMLSTQSTIDRRASPRPPVPSAADDLDVTDVRQAVWLAEHLHLLDPTSPTVGRLVNHPDWRVRAGIGRAAVARPQVAPLATAVDVLLSDDDHRVRAAVVAALTAVTSLVPHLDRLLFDENWCVRRATVEKVVEWNDPGLTKTACIAILDDPRWMNCRSAARDGMQRLLLLAEPRRYCDEFSDTTWKLLRENTTGHRRLAPETETILRMAARRSPLGRLRREAACDAPGEPLAAPSRPRAWRRLRDRRSIQVALNVHDIEYAVDVATAVAAAGCRLIEVGEPLMKAAGTGAITRVKDHLPEVTVVAAVTAIDKGGDEVELAAVAGADVVFLSGVVDPTSIVGACDTGRRYGVPVILDVPATATLEWVREVESASTGVDGLCVSAETGLVPVGQAPLDRAEILRQHTRLPVAVAGGFSPHDRLDHRDWDILIVSRAVTDAVEPQRVAADFVEMAQRAESRRG
ncbi:3-keto-L-gulonate-6-phosphate decarboxylase [Stackebrandtia endophytica]|uniref:3-keto-L-gulonate-6-phosphate decarboxylase n=1 Tax=Stackebrandtia endophytica TaxID=1496996 RepID=A0A543AVK2_9ACTN|nr:orotidine 5'-phosphate decarboxylase / HUMPS family protein [Stackebrandtia endophytica]TQL76610.1 3-keto-L-gulonate-6-phosphate decarboxylase [Stackebrandtia endophytica]